MARGLRWSAKQLREYVRRFLPKEQVRHLEPPIVLSATASACAITFVVPDRAPRWNDALRCHPNPNVAEAIVKQRWRKHLEGAYWTLPHEARGSGRMVARGPRSVRITRSHPPGQPLDRLDNLPSIAKVILDPLTELGWLLDDGDEGVIPPPMSGVDQEPDERAYTRIVLGLEDLRP